MAVLIGKHEFEGPLGRFPHLTSEAGLYALLHEDSSGFMLVDIDEVENFSQDLPKRCRIDGSLPVVILPCLSRSERRTILMELLREFEFEDEESTVERARRRSETNKGVALSI